MLRVVPDERAREEFAVDLDEIVRQGARRMLAEALEAEVDGYLAELDPVARTPDLWPAVATRKDVRHTTSRA